MNTTTADARSAATTDQPETGQPRRSADDRMLAGVAGGIAAT
jgi:PspC domain